MAGLVLPAAKSAQKADMEVNAKRNANVLMVPNVTTSVESASVPQAGPEHTVSKPVRMVSMERTAFISASAGMAECATTLQDTALVLEAGPDWLVNKNAL